MYSTQGVGKTYSRCRGFIAVQKGQRETLWGSDIKILSIKLSHASRIFEKQDGVSANMSRFTNRFRVKIRRQRQDEFSDE